MTRISLLDACARKPSIYASLRLGYRPDTYQTDILDSQETDILLNWCRQSGKTETAATRVAHTAIYKPGTLSLIVSATQRQAGILQSRVQRAIQGESRHGWVVVKSLQLPYDPLDPNSRLVRCSILSLELANGSEVISVPASPDTVRGYSPDVLVLDEAARIPDLVYDAIRPMRSAKRSTLVAMSTPAGKRGWYHKAWIDTAQHWYRSLVRATQCPRITVKYLDDERVSMSSEAMYRQEYYCEFIEIDGAVFAAGDIDAMRSTESMLLPARVGGGGVGVGVLARDALLIDGGLLY